MKTFRVALVLVAATATLWAGKNKESGAKVVDSGTFRILLNDKQIGTETFSIQQQGDHSITSSQIKVTADAKAEQSSVLEMTSSGELVRYAWKETSPDKAETSVDVVQGAVLQHLTLPQNKKPLDVPYMIPPTTMVLDDNFFSHRQLLIWRYLAESCKTVDGKASCAMKPLKLGILVPAQHTPAVITVDFVGNEKITINGKERDLLRFKLMADDVEWAVWADGADSYKVQRIVVPSMKTEVVRD